MSRVVEEKCSAMYGRRWTAQKNEARPALLGTSRADKSCGTTEVATTALRSKARWCACLDDDLDRDVRYKEKCMASEIRAYGRGDDLGHSVGTLLPASFSFMLSANHQTRSPHPCYASTRGVHLHFYHLGLIYSKADSHFCFPSHTHSQLSNITHKSGGKVLPEAACWS